MTLLSWRPCTATEHREQSAAVHALLNDLLQKAGFKPGELTHTDTGRPYFRDLPELDFSLSHTNGMVACALSFGTGAPRVGVDVEADLADSGKAARLARRFFREAEQEYLNSSESLTRAFAEVFTAKEAYGKYIGDGLAVHLGDDTASADFPKAAGIAFFRYRVGPFCITLCQKATDPAPETVFLPD